MRFLWLFILLIAGLAQGETISSTEVPGKAVSDWFVINGTSFPGANNEPEACAQYRDASDYGAVWDAKQGRCINAYSPENAIYLDRERRKTVCISLQNG